MTEGSATNKTQVWVALITVVGGLLTAIVVNADKWFPQDDKAAVAKSPATATQTQRDSAAPTPGAATVDISGEWRSDDGARFGFTQSGSSYEYTHTAPGGAFQSAGKGTISSHDLSHTFQTATGEAGKCTAHVNAAANKMTGSCHDQHSSWNFSIER